VVSLRKAFFPARQAARNGWNSERMRPAAAGSTLALCYGWIDGQAAPESDAYWLQRFTPSTRRSKCSRINGDCLQARCGE
jgi:uncharacterized protein YdeI (YjbR/CyaY-like superfamily)